MARIIKPPMFCDRLIEACRYEYKTRHLIDGRIVQCDQRISIVAGYLTDEISGLSPFTFIHRGWLNNECNVLAIKSFYLIFFTFRWCSMGDGGTPTK